MENKLLRIKLKQRLNKLASSDYVNIECWQEAELINKAQLQWIRRQVHGTNSKGEGDEGSKIRIDDLNILIDTKDLKSANKKDFFETEELPKNYLFFKKVNIIASKEGCDKKKRIRCTLVEEANAEWLLDDNLRSPSFKWGETFVTLSGNKLKVWTGGDFIIDSISLSYYRLPKYVSFADCRDVNDNVGVEQNLEFKDDVAELIIDEAISIASGDYNDYNNMQRSQQSVETSN